MGQARSNPQAPYVGLRSFREGDSSFFFGREREIRVIASNLLNEPLTILYGPSGVGKSSVLQAGVVAHLRAESKTPVLYFNSWQNETFLDELIAQCRDLTTERSTNSGKRAETLDETLAAFPERLLLILDQFEEYLLYQSPQGTGEQFERALARIVNQEAILTNVLIGIREDGLSKLDQRFALRIANLLGNTLPFGYLTVEAAKRSIEKPIETWNSQCTEGSPRVTVEPELVAEILYQVETGKVAASESSGTGMMPSSSAQNAIETAFLQLVLTRLWEEERRQESFALRLATLKAIGGANQIVQNHVNDVMSHFDRDSDRDICAGIFRHLVTPSRTKIAQKVEDLIVFAQTAEADVKAVLNRLTDRPDARILRRLTSPERYEVYHDVLTQPVLDWRQHHIQKKETEAEENRLRAEADQKQRELEQAQAMVASETRLRQLEVEAHQKTQALVESERLRTRESERAARRLWILAGALALVSVFAVYIAFRERGERKKLEEATRKLEEATRAAEQIGVAVRRFNDTQAAHNEQEAEIAQQAGQSVRAEELRKEAERNRLAARPSVPLYELVLSLVYQLQKAQSDRAIEQQLSSPSMVTQHNNSMLTQQFSPPPPSVLGDKSMLTQHNDSMRSGAYLRETELTPVTVATGMRLRYSRPVNGILTAQLIYAHGVKIHSTPRNVIYAFTQQNTVYAYDADEERDSGTNRGLIWSRSLPVTPVPGLPFPQKGWAGGGILSTPVVDDSSGRLYLVYAIDNGLFPANGTGDGSPLYEVEFHLAALDLTSGAVLQDKVVTGSVSTATSPGSVDFVPRRQIQRAGLLLLRNPLKNNERSIYVAFAGRWLQSTHNYHGWVMAYDAKTLAPRGVFCTTPDRRENGDGGGIWQGGGGLAGDENGNVYFNTGDGPASGNDHGNSIVKLTPVLRAGEYDFNVQAFSAAADDPAHANQWRYNDLSLGSGGITLIPDSLRLVSGGKTGVLYLIDRRTMTKVESFEAFSVNPANDPDPEGARWRDWGHGPHLDGAWTYWVVSPTRGYIYHWAQKDFLRRFDYDSTTGQVNPASVVTGDVLAKPYPVMPGGLISLSANGTKDGLLWITLLWDNGTGRIMAVDALTLRRVWDTAAPGGTSVSHNGPPTVADGKVIVGTTNGNFLVYGLTSPTAAPKGQTAVTPSRSDGGHSLCNSRASPTVGVGSGRSDKRIRETLGACPYQKLRSDELVEFRRPSL